MKTSGGMGQCFEAPYILLTRLSFRDMDTVSALSSPLTSLSSLDDLDDPMDSSSSRERLGDMQAAQVRVPTATVVDLRIVADRSFSCSSISLRLAKVFQGRLFRNR